MRATPEEAQAAGESLMKKCKGVYAYMTPPYEVPESKAYPGLYDVSVPESVRAMIGAEKIALYLKSGD